MQYSASRPVFSTLWNLSEMALRAHLGPSVGTRFLTSDRASRYPKPPAQRRLLTNLAVITAGTHLPNSAPGPLCPLNLSLAWSVTVCRSTAAWPSAFEHDR